MLSSMLVANIIVACLVWLIGGIKFAFKKGLGPSFLFGLFCAVSYYLVTGLFLAMLVGLATLI